MIKEASTSLRLPEPSENYERRIVLQTAKSRRDAACASVTTLTAKTP